MPTYRLSSSPAWPGTASPGFTSRCCSPMDNLLPSRSVSCATLGDMHSALAEYGEQLKTAFPAAGFVAHITHTCRDRKLTGYNKAVRELWHFPEGCTETASMAAAGQVAA